MSHPATQKFMADLLAIGRRVIEQTAKDAAEDLRKGLSIPAASKADASFVISSAPGEFPRMRTGKLRASVFHRVIEDQGVRLYFEIGATAYYSRFLESGTSRMAARPHKAPTVEKWRPILTARLNAAYGK
jgi:HK97 gp10 family phage protein